MRTDHRMRLAVLYLVAVSIAAFATSSPWVVLPVLGLQVVLFVAAGNPLRRLLQALRRPAVFVAFLAVMPIVFPDESARPGDPWVVSIGLTDIDVWPDAVYHALLMAARVYAVILASGRVRVRGGVTGFVGALRGLGLPLSVALTIDATFTYLDPGGAQPGDRRGRGRDGRARDGDRDEAETRIRLKDLVHGRSAFVREALLKRLRWAEATLRARGLNVTPDQLADASLLAALTILTTLLRAFQILPDIPFAPGHKGIIIVPLYLIAGRVVSAGRGGTKLGLAVGLVSLFLGQGKFGVLDVLKHLFPGILADLLLAVTGGRRRERPAWVYGLLGAAVASGRFLAMMVIVVLMEAPKVTAALLAPVLLSQCAFGALSGFVATPLVAAVVAWREEVRARDGPDGGRSDS